MSNAPSNAFGNALPARSVTREETSGECARTRNQTRHQTPEPITTSRGRLVGHSMPCLNYRPRAIDRRQIEQSTWTEAHAASCGATEEQR